MGGALRRLAVACLLPGFELRPDPSIPAGTVPWGLGSALAAQDPGVTVIPCHDPGAAGVVCTHGAGRVNAEAAVEVLLGGV
jgi:hypothetical protein